MSDAWRRSIRTFAQSLPAGALIALWQAFAPVEYQMSMTQVAAVMAVLTALTSYGQNKAEDSPTVRMPALLKSKASSGVNPVTSDAAK